MKKKFLFLAILVLMFLPKNVFALTGSYPINTLFDQTWHKYSGSASDIYVSSSVRSATSSTVAPYLPYNFNSDTYRTINNNGYGILWYYFNNSGNGFAMCTESCDLTLSFDWSVSYRNWDNTGRLIARSYFNTLVDVNNLSDTANLNMALIGKDLNQNTKDFYCTSSLVSSSFPSAQGPDYPWYYKFHSVCKTSNFSMIDKIRFGTSWWKYDYNQSLEIFISFSNLSYTISAYTGTQDSDGTSNIYNQTTVIQNGLDNIDNTMKDDNIDSTFQNSTINSMNSQLATNSVISDLLLLPVTMYQSILNSLNSNTCTTYNLGSLYGTNLTLPCIQVQNYIGSTLWTTIDLIFCGMFILVIRKKFVDIFNNMTNLKNGGNEIE